MAKDEADVGPQLDRTMLGLVERYGGERGSQALALLAAGQVAAPLVKWVRKRALHREKFTITVSGMDDVYTDLHEWVLERMPELDRKALIATTSSSRGATAYPSADDGPPRRQRVRLRYDGSRVQMVVLDGFKVQVQVEREEIPGGRAGISEGFREMTEKITFTSATAGGRDAVVNVIEELVKSKEGKKGLPPLMIPSRWGGEWRRRNDLPPRTLESCLLKPGQTERLEADLGSFLAAESEYARRHQPWHRGYLFHGAPGTGKTSIARALANRFEIPVYYLPMADLEKDAELMQLVGGIEPRSLLLLEDITEAKGEKAATSVAAMLNALDGIWTPHGLVTVLTTNHRDELDDAMVRRGRIDVEEEFTVLDQEQAERIVVWWQDGDDFGCTAYGRQFDGRSPAELIGALQDYEQEVDRAKGDSGADGVRDRVEADGPGFAQGGLVNGDVPYIV